MAVLRPVKRNRATIGRPSRATWRRPAKGSKLDGIAAIPLAGPEFSTTRAARDENNPLTVRRELGLLIFLCRRDEPQGSTFPIRGIGAMLPVMKSFGLVTRKAPRLYSTPLSICPDLVHRTVPTCASAVTRRGWQRPPYCAYSIRNSGHCGNPLALGRWRLPRGPTGFGKILAADLCVRCHGTVPLS